MEDISTMEVDEIPTKETPLELLSDTTIVVDGIEEGPLCELGEEMEKFPGTNEIPLNRSGWKEFVSDSGYSVTEGINGRTSGQSYFSDDVQTRKQRDWTQFLSTSHLVEGKRSSNTTHLKTDEDLKRHEVSPNNLIDMTVRQKIVPDVRDKSSKTPMHHGNPVVNSLPQPSDVVMRTSSVPLSQTLGNLPARPLTIGDSMTIGNSLGYRPVSLFTPAGNPPQTSSSTPVIPTLPPSILQHSEDILDAEIDVPGDMSARERLQPLGRDGLEVKQGPPWGVTIPLFQPHSRKSSFSSNDSGSSHGSTSHLQPQTTSVQTMKVDTESSLPVVSTEGSLSQRSSLRSLESKEPMAAKALSPNEYLNTSVGKFHALKPIEADVDSPVSKILGPTFKTTQKMLEELQRRPLGVYNDTVEQQPREKDGSLKMVTKENEGFSHSKERVVDRKDKSFNVDLPENKHTANNSQTSDFFEMKPNQSTKSDNSINNSNQLSSTDVILRSTSYFPHENKVDHSFNESSQIGESQKGDQQKISLFNKSETPKTSGLTDSTLGNSVAISENVHSGNHVINDVTRLRSKRTADVESLSWDNVMEVHSTSGEMSEFDRIASESISLSNAVANRFREELKSVDLLDIESDDEGILDDERINRATPDSGVSESSTNDEIFHPKGLVPLSNQCTPVGIYDVRLSSGPGSSNRKRLALGKLPREISQPSLHAGVYVSEGTTGTEVEDRGVESYPEGQSTPKSDDVVWIRNNDDEELVNLDSLPTSMLRGVNISRKSCNFINVQPSAAVEHTWSISKPVMSQLDPKRTPLVNSEAKQKPKQRTRHENESVYSSEKERKRILRHREHSKKTSKSVKQHSHFSESSEHSPRDTSGETKRSLADMILENFRREEKEQERRLKKLEELKQYQTSSDLNELWKRFQELISKKDSQSRTSRQRSRSSQHSISSSNLSVASSSDTLTTEDKPRDHTVNLSTDSNEEFENFLKRVREVPSSDTASIVSRGSSNNHPRRQHDHRSTPIARINRKPHTKVTVLSSIDQITSTSGKPSEPETTLSLPMWLGVNAKHPKKKTKSAKKTNEAIQQKEAVKPVSTVCTCGGRVKKVTTKANDVRDVGVNCPTPPVFSPPVLANEMNTVNVGAFRINTLEEECEPTIQAPPSLVKLTLQDAFMYSKQYFIKRSRERIRNIREKGKEASAGDVVVIPTDKLKSKRENVNEEAAKIETSKPLKLFEELQKRKPRQMTQKEIRDVNKRYSTSNKSVFTRKSRMYKNLPEVKKKNDDQRRVDFYKTNRLRAKLYGRHVRNNLNRMYTTA